MQIEGGVTEEIREGVEPEKPASCADSGAQHLPSTRKPTTCEWERTAKVAFECAPSAHASLRVRGQGPLISPLAGTVEWSLGGLQLNTIPSRA